MGAEEQFQVRNALGLFGLATEAVLPQPARDHGTSSLLNSLVGGGDRGFVGADVNFVALQYSSTVQCLSHSSEIPDPI